MRDRAWTTHSVLHAAFHLLAPMTVHERRRMTDERQRVNLGRTSENVMMQGTNVVFSLAHHSGRQDSNLRLPAPKAGALPGCATPRSCSPFPLDRTASGGAFDRLPETQYRRLLPLEIASPRKNGGRRVNSILRQRRFEGNSPPINRPKTVPPATRSARPLRHPHMRIASL